MLAESLGFGWGLLGCWILVGPSLCCLLGCLVVLWCRGVGMSGYLGGVCVAVLLRSGDVLGCGAAWDWGLCSWRCVVYFMFLVVLWWVAGGVVLRWCWASRAGQ